MEIERKFTIKQLPEDLERYESKRIVQGYLNVDPVIRIRKQNDEYFLTVKGKGLLAREETNLRMNEESFIHLLPKCDGNVISKTRYLIPLYDPSFAEEYEGERPKELLIELDIFDEPFSPLIMAEVEFPDVEMAKAFLMPEWFDEDVTDNREYHNSNMSRKVFN